MTSAAFQTIQVTIAPTLAPTISVLAEALDRFLQVGEGSVHRLQPVAQALGLDLDWALASRAVDGGIVLEPSEQLLELVAASGAGEFERVLIQIHGGLCCGS